MCNPRDNICYLNGTIPDARMADASNPPDTTITGMPATLGNMATVTYTFTSDKAGATFECRIGGATATFMACTTPHMRTPGDGMHVFEVRAVAGGLTDPTPASHTFTIDTMPPVVNITAGPSGSVTDTSATFSFTSSESPSTFMCRMDGGAMEACTSSKAYPTLALGTHTFVVTARDAAGNTSTPAMRVFTIVVPAELDTTITSAPPVTTTSTSATFAFTASQAGATFECSLDGAGFAACTSGVSFTNLSEVEHTFRVRAVLGSDVDDSPASHTWTVDTTGLTAVILTGAEGGVSAGSVTFTYMASDPTASFECGLDGVFAACAATGATFTNLTHGSSHVFGVRAVKGDETGPADTRPFTVDAQGPVINVTVPVGGSTVGPNVTITFTVDEQAELTCLIDGDEVTPCESGMTVALEDGEHTLVINGVDAVGNPGTTSVTFNVEATGPTAVISFPSNGLVVGPSGEIIFSAEGATSVTCTLDGSAVACTTPTYAYTLPGGEHTFTVQAFDGGVGGAPATVTFTVDASPPVVQQIVLLDGSDPGTSQLALTLFDLSVITSVRCRLDGGSFFGCGAGATPTVTLEELSPGAHLIEVFAIDIFGNSGLAPTSEDPAATFARMTFVQVTGPGHLMMIGYDYEFRCGGIILKLPGAPVEPCGPDQILANSVSQAAAVQAGFERGVRVVAYVGGDTEADERDNVRDIIDEQLFDDAGSFSWFSTFTDADLLDQELAGADVLVILDQNDADGNELFAIGEEWRASLQVFLDAGGIVIVTSGRHGDGQVSDTWLLADSSLLPIQGSTLASDFHSVPCNLGEPILASFNGEGGIFHDFNQFGFVGFFTAAPWIAYEATRGNDERFRDPTVLHRWFGTTNEGPIGVTASQGGFRKTPDPEDYFFQDFQGRFVAKCDPAGNGTAVHHMLGAGHVSAGFLTFTGPAKLPQEAGTRLVTVLDANPLEHIIMERGFFGVLVQPPPAMFTVNVDLPDFEGEADFFRVTAGCGGNTTDNTVDEVPVDVGCTNANGTFSLVAEAITVNVDTQVETVLAYSIQNGVNEGSVQPVGMPDWTATPVYTFNTGSIEDIARVGWYGALVVGDLWYWIADGQQYEDTTAPYQFQIYTAAGRGTPAMSQAYHYEFMDFPADPDDFVAYTDREFQGARPSNWNLDLAAGLLPRFGHPSGFVEDLTHDALMVTVNTDGNAAFDGGRVNFDWDFGLHSWTIVFPGPDREFAAPPEPWIDVDIQLPGWLNYWPNLNDTIRGRGGNIDEATFVGDWDQYKFFYVGEGAFPTTGYTWRSSWLFSFFIIKGDQFPGKLSNGKPSIFPGWRAAR